MLDVFKNNAFSSISLTAAINLLPYAPARLGKLGLFRTKSITTMTAVVERKGNKLSLLPTRARGTASTAMPRGSRKARTFEVPHIPVNDEVLAHEVQNVRAFGSEDSNDAVAAIVNERLESMKQSLELTKEFHRVGCISGQILDADASTVIYNLFTEFGITETSVNFDFTVGAQDMKLKALEVIRAIEDALGAQTYTRIHALCGNNFFDNFISHESVKSAFERYQDNQFSRVQQNGEGGFEYAGITWENYRGSVGGTNFIHTDKARFFPVGVPDLFQEIYAPANFTEAVNTPGKPFYAKQSPMEFDVGVKLHAQSNPLMLCTQPEVLILGE